MAITPNCIVHIRILHGKEIEQRVAGLTFAIKYRYHRHAMAKKSHGVFQRIDSTLKRPYEIRGNVVQIPLNLWFYRLLNS